MNYLYTLFILSLLVSSCKTEIKNSDANIAEIATIEHIRHQEDTIGFAQYTWQMDSIISRIPEADKQPTDGVYKAVINPHDDYAYAGGLYTKTLAGVKAKTIILIGVAHRARNFELQDKLIFGSFDAWKSPYGTIKVSSLRNKILQNLSEEHYVVHDSMMQLEHSLEAITPFLQRQNTSVEIIPILIPYMTFADMQKFSAELSEAVSKIMTTENLNYGKDIAVVISNDAIHYGDEEWGSSNLAPFGTTKEGNEKAHQKDQHLISEYLTKNITSEKIKAFNTETVQPENYKEYKWTWCGRYSVQFGLLFANKLNQDLNNSSLTGTLIDYRSSLKSPHIKVEDLGMGHTAIANEHHWVAYAGLSYE